MSLREKRTQKDLYRLKVRFLEKVLEDFLNYSDIVSVSGRDSQNLPVGSELGVLFPTCL